MSLTGNTRIAFSEEQAMLLDVAREFCRAKAPREIVRAQLETPRGYDPDTWQAMVELGWTAIALPESAGGSALGPGSVVPVFEAMGRAMLGTPLLSTTLAGQLLGRAAPGMHEEVLADIATGAVATIAALEGGDWGAAPQCHLDDDGRLVGSKRLVGDAHVAAYFLVVLAVEEAPALALLRREQLDPSRIRESELIDQTRRAATVDVTGVEPLALIVGPAVAPALRDVELLGALYVAAEAAGSAAACLDTTVDYLKTRKQFGKLIGSYQALKHPAVEILCEVDSSRSFVYHGATLVGDGALDRDAEIACRMAKAQATETLCYAGDRAVQFHGGMGFTYECDAQLYIRRAQWVQQQYGDAQHHRKRLAGLLLDAA
ncbi:acyl-CoA dehydrogenase family protein [Pseudohaliea rubra]|uniref:Acyl-CoA dehydrogenase, short-chain specific n=1 Tax=Pseudohaliea rubra DSM 19751 TaxID=1265313 RepID=A0A095X1H0_9GAMM|nr:acyl-CoA dehydrogenase family protein [Pseudohaliea rubra]KGE04709.1 Acyl-CoA dehydrogenase, short-chain specific [Pseudohaliea rubra DSM 19751]